MSDPNVECKRCGLRWYAPQYDERDILPRHCPRCYRDDIGEIPEEPTVVEKMVMKGRSKVEQIPGVLERWNRRFTLWRENNRQLIELAGLLIGLSIIIYVMYLFVFVWG